MTEWQIVYGGQTSTPAEFDTASSKFYVYQRRNIQRVTENNISFWQYEERKLSFDEYENLRITLLENDLTAKLDSDATAVAAFNDGVGNDISHTYATKAELEDLQLSGGGFSPILVVTSYNAETLSVSNGTTTLTAAFVNKTAFINLPSFGNWTVTVSKDERTKSVSVNVDTVKIYELSIVAPVRYGYRISKTESDPDARVEYLYDAVGMRPAHMDFDSDSATFGTFNYGDWQDVWFVKDNKPCMLKYDGTVGYYLNPNNYALKEDGTASDVANTSYGGNAMAQIPLVWVKRYEDDDYLYEIVSDVQWDENYKAYAHTDKDGNIKPYFYVSMFASVYSNNKLRSISGQSTSNYNATSTQLLNYAAANGSNWSATSWSQYQFIRTLTVLISKTCDSQSAFGFGTGYSGDTNLNSKIYSGTLISKGQFYGLKTTGQLKIFHIEQPWGSQYYILAGFFAYNGNAYVKMTPPYNSDSVDGYSIAYTYPQSFDGFGSQASVSEFGLLPVASDGSASTYFCDRMYFNVSNTICSCWASGAEADNNLGIFTFNGGGTKINDSRTVNYGVKLSCV